MLVIIIIAVITTVKCRQRQLKLQRVQAQPALHTYDTPVQRLSQSAFDPGGMSRGSGPAEDYRGYLQPSRSGGRQPTVSNMAFTGGLEGTPV